jgi:tape measure domain-containing protein
MAADLGSAYFTLIPSMAGFSAAVNKQLGSGGGIGTSAGRTVGSQFTGGFASVVGGGAIAGVFGGVAAAATNAIGNAVGSAFKAAGDAVIGFNSQLQNSTIGFEAVLGSSKKATAFVGDLQKFAAKTPFDFQSLVQYAQTLTGFGVSAKRVIPTLTALGDAVANSGGSTAQLNGAVLAYSQLAAKQKVDLGNILQLQNAGIPALKYLAAAYHTNVGAIQDQISAGKILSADALPKLNAAIENGAASAPALGGAMDKLSTTFAGVVSNIKDNATQVIAKAFKPLFDTATLGLSQVATALGSSSFKTFATEFAANLQGMLKGVDFSSLATNIEGALLSIQTVAGQVLPALQTAFSALGPAFASAGTALGPVFAQALTTLAPVLATLIPQIAQLATQLLPSLVQIVLAVAPLIPPIASILTTLAPVISGIATGLSFLVTSVLVPLTTQLSLGFQAFSALAGGMSLAQFTAQAATGAFGVMFQTAVQLGTGVRDMSTQIGLAVVGIVGFFTDMQSSVSTAVVNAAISISGFAQSAAAGIGGFVSDSIAAFGRFVTGIGGKIGEAIDSISKIPGRATAAIGDIGGLLYSSGQSIVQGFIDGIGSMIGAVGRKVSEVMSAVTDFLPHSPAKRGPFSGSGWTQVGKSGQALAAQFAGGFNSGVKDFASTVGSIVPDTLTSSVAGTIRNTTRSAPGLYVPETITIRDARGFIATMQTVVDGHAAEENRVYRLGVQPAVLGA